MRQTAFLLTGLFAFFAFLIGVYNPYANGLDAGAGKTLADMADISGWYGDLKDKVSQSDDAPPCGGTSMTVSLSNSAGWIQRNLGGVAAPVGSKLHFYAKGDGSARRFAVYLADYNTDVSKSSYKGFWSGGGKNFDLSSREWTEFVVDIVNEIPYEDGGKTRGVALNLNALSFLKIYIHPGKTDGKASFGRMWLELPAPDKASTSPAALMLGAGKGEYGVAGELEKAGYRIASIGYDRVSFDFLSQFNAVIIGAPPGEELQGKEAPIRDVLLRYVQAGGGILLSHGGGGWDLGRKSANALISPFAAELLDEQIADPPNTAKIGYTKAMVFPLACTTEIAGSPVSQGVKKIWYPTCSWRADGIKTALAFKVSPDWQVVVKGMPTAYSAKSVRLRGWELEKEPATYRECPPLMAVRQFGKGRVALLPIQGSFLLSGARHPIWGGVLWNGNAAHPCDMDKLFLNTVAWLADGSKGVFGGYPVQADDAKAPASFKPQLVDWTKEAFPERKNDFYTGLFGAHTALSDGKGSVAEFCAEARKNGYGFIVFTERFDAMNPAKWEELKQQCKAECGEGFLAIPGMDYIDTPGNQYITWGWFPYPDANILSPDGRKVDYSYKFFTQNYSLIAITRLNSNPNYFKDLKHYAFMAVQTYKGGKLVEDVLPEYLSLAGDSYNPAPITLHQIYSPSEVAGASREGMQTRVMANSMKELKSYIAGPRQYYYFDQPCPIYLSSGPSLDFLGGLNMNSWRVAAQGTEKWKMKFAVSSEDKVKELKVMDGDRLWLRLMPDARKVEKVVDGYHVRQQNFVITAKTESGKELVSPSLKTLVLRQCYSQCADYQNYISSSFQRGLNGRVKEMTGGLGNHYAAFNLFWTVAVNLDLETLFPPGWDGTLTAYDGLAAPDIPFEKGGDIWPDFATTHNPYLISSELMIMDDLASAKYPPGTPERMDCKPVYKTIPTEFVDVKLRKTAFAIDTYKPGFTLIDGEIKVKKDFGMKSGDVGLIQFHGWTRDGILNYFTIRDRDGKCVTRPVQGPASFKGVLGSGDYVAFWPLGTGSPALFCLDGEMNYSVNIGKDGNFNVWLGCHLEGKTLRAGTSLKYQVLAACSVEDGTGACEWARSSMGLADGATSYSVKLDRGSVISSKYLLKLQAKDGGVSGVVSKAKLPQDLPVMVSGVSDRICAGVYDKEAQKLKMVPVKDNAAYLLLKIDDKAKNVYAGNLFSCDNAELILSLAQRPDGKFNLSVNNPTDSDIEATIGSCPEVKAIPQFSKKMRVRAGELLEVDL